MVSAGDIFLFVHISNQQNRRLTVRWRPGIGVAYAPRLPEVYLIQITPGLKSEAGQTRLGMSSAVAQGSRYGSSPDGEQHPVAECRRVGLVEAFDVVADGSAGLVAVSETGPVQ